MSRELIRKPFHYDAASRRVWIYGQRCHHGATGVLLTATGAVGLIALRLRGPVLLAALCATGGAMMVHDWKDRALWFSRGWQE